MKEAHDELVIRRVLVAVDASPHSLAALETAAQLATCLGAELMGLFVEDVNLKRLTELPVAREVRYFSLTSHACGERAVDGQFQAQARRARQALASVAAGSGLAWSFRVVRGQVAHEVLNAAAEGDLMALGQVGFRPARGQLGSTARRVLEGHRGLTLVHPARARRDLPVVVLHDGSPEARRALGVAARLAARSDRALVVLELGGEAAEHDDGVLSRWLEEHPGVKHRRLPNLSPSVVLHTLGPEAGCLLVLPGSHRLDEDAVAGLVRNLTGPVLTVR